jgi:hypothetical protein
MAHGGDGGPAVLRSPVLRAAQKLLVALAALLVVPIAAGVFISPSAACGRAEERGTAASRRCRRSHGRARSLGDDLYESVGVSVPGLTKVRLDQEKLGLLRTKRAHVLDVQSDELGAAEPVGEPEAEDCSISLDVGRAAAPPGPP